MAPDTFDLCPFLGVEDDPETKCTFAFPGHLCYQGDEPAKIPLDHQDRYCLKSSYRACPRLPVEEGRMPEPTSVTPSVVQVDAQTNGDALAPVAGQAAQTIPPDEASVSSPIDPASTHSEDTRPEEASSSNGSATTSSSILLEAASGAVESLPGEPEPPGTEPPTHDALAAIPSEKSQASSTQSATGPEPNEAEHQDAPELDAPEIAAPVIEAEEMPAAGPVASVAPEATAPAVPPPTAGQMDAPKPEEPSTEETPAGTAAAVLSQAADTGPESEASPAETAAPTEEEVVVVRPHRGKLLLIGMASAALVLVVAALAVVVFYGPDRMMGADESMAFAPMYQTATAAAIAAEQSNPAGQQSPVAHIIATRPAEPTKASVANPASPAGGLQGEPAASSVAGAEGDQIVLTRTMTPVYEPPTATATVPPPTPTASLPPMSPGPAYLLSQSGALLALTPAAGDAPAAQTPATRSQPTASLPAAAATLPVAPPAPTTVRGPAQPTPSQPLPSAGAIQHRVKAGETLTGIAAFYGVTPDAIVAANNLRDEDHIITNMVLIIPRP